MKPLGKLLLIVLWLLRMPGCSPARSLVVNEASPPSRESLPESTDLPLGTGAAFPAASPVPEDEIEASATVPFLTSLLVDSPDSTESPEKVKLCSPLASHALEQLSAIVSAPYSPPPPGREERHHGVDFAFYQDVEPRSILGETVQSVLPGRVALAVADSFPYGNLVIIETPLEILGDELRVRLGLEPGQSLYVLYAHMEAAPLVHTLDPVDACQPLGKAGKSGNAAVPHLHLETRRGPTEVSFSGMQFYDTRAKKEDMENYLRWRISGDFTHFDPFLLLSTN